MLHQTGGAVSWAGDGPAPVWLDVAREYTEYWMHHQHICNAVGVTSMKDRRHFHPVLDTLIRALPHTCRDVVAGEGTVVTLALTGEAADSWHLLHGDTAWMLYTELDESSACTITMPDDVAWRLFTNGIATDDARPHVTVKGDIILAEPVLRMVSIIA